MVTGLMTMPDSYFFTVRTAAACSSMLRFCTTPMSPACAMVMAMGASVIACCRDAHTDAARNAGAGLGFERDDLRALGLEQYVIKVERHEFAWEKVLALSLSARAKTDAGERLWNLWVER